MNGDMVRMLDDVGRHPEVLAALNVLRPALANAVRAAGFNLQTVALVWCSERDGDGFSGCLIDGNADPEVIEMMAETLMDDSSDVDIDARRGLI